MGIDRAVAAASREGARATTNVGFAIGR